MPETAGGEVTYEKTPKYMVIPEVPGKIIEKMDENDIIYII